MKHLTQHVADAVHSRKAGILALMVLLCAGLVPLDLSAQKIKVPEEQAAHGVSMAYHQGKYFLAWTGLSNRLYIMRSDEGVDWRAKIALDERSGHAPDIASDGQYLYLLWSGENSDKLYVMRSEDGVDWRNKVVFDESTDARPAITASDDGRLLVAWKGKDSNKIHLLQSRDGVDWGAKIVLDEKTFNGPTLADFNGRFVLAWTGISENNIYIMQSTEGVDWRAKIRLDENSRKAPSLAVYNTGTYDDPRYRLFLGWIGEDKGDIYVMQTTDGVDWSSKVRTGEHTLKSLKLVGGHRLAIGFQGLEKGDVYCLMSRDGVDF